MKQLIIRGTLGYLAGALVYLKLGFSTETIILSLVIGFIIGVVPWPLKS